MLPDECTSFALTPVRPVKEPAEPVPPRDLDDGLGARPVRPRTGRAPGDDLQNGTCHAHGGEYMMCDQEGGRGQQYVHVRFVWSQSCSPRIIS